MIKEPAIICENVTKSFRQGDIVTRALRGVNLTVNQGELLMLVGPSGCGKTTLISIIAGILDNDSGRCLVNGYDFSKLSERERSAVRGRTIGFVFQSFNLIPTLTAAENVCIPLLIAGNERKLALEKAYAILDRVGLGSKLASFPRELSGGQQQRVAIARSLVHNPEILVCDEPTSALDEVTGHKIMEIFKEIAMSEQRTLIVVTHDDRIYEFGDRLAHMNDGEITKIETMSQDYIREPQV